MKFEPYFLSFEILKSLLLSICDFFVGEENEVFIGEDYEVFIEEEFSTVKCYETLRFFEFSIEVVFMLFNFIFLSK